MRPLAILALVAIVGCRADVPDPDLKVERNAATWAHGHARVARSGSLAIDSVSGPLADGSGTFLGTVTITSIGRTATGDALFFTGRFSGTATQGEAVTEVSGTPTNAYLRVNPVSSLCNHFDFTFHDFLLPSLGTSVPVPRAAQRTIADRSLERALCQLAWEVMGDKNLTKEDRYLSTINGILGG